MVDLIEDVHSDLVLPPNLQHPVVAGGDSKTYKKKISVYKSLSACTVLCFASQLSSGKGKYAVALKCLIQLYYKSQRLSVYIVTETGAIPNFYNIAF